MLKKERWNRLINYLGSSEGGEQIWWERRKWWVERQLSYGVGEGAEKSEWGERLLGWMSSMNKSTEDELKGGVCGLGSCPNWMKHTVYNGDESKRELRTRLQKPLGARLKSLHAHWSLVAFEFKLAIDLGIPYGSAQQLVIILVTSSAYGWFLPCLVKWSYSQIIVSFPS